MIGKTQLLALAAALVLMHPPAVAEAPEDGCPLPHIEGAWHSIDDGPERWFYFDGSRVLSAQDGQVHPVTRVVSCDAERVELCSMGQIRTLKIEPGSETLQIADSGTMIHDAKTPRPYERLEEVPDLFRLETHPVPEPKGDLTPERTEELRQELLTRWEEDQKIRREVTRSETPDWGKMLALDRDNTAWLKGLIAEIGWPDPQRFGEEAARTAWLIVQHSMDIPLMEGALPHVKRYGPGPDYARLYDRLEVWKGGDQRYATQFTRDDRGPGLMPIETLDEIDAIRETMDLGPLAEYAARMGIENLEELRVIDCE